MEEKSLKTSWWQRVVILIVAVLLLGSTVFAYLFIVMGNSGSSSSNNTETEIAQLETAYDNKKTEIENAAKPLSEQYFSGFSGYLNRVKSYNSANANADGLKTEDLKVGNGKTITEGDTDYLAYYIGWCSDGSIFDSSINFKDTTNHQDPESLKAPLDPSMGLIEGWNQGVIGMKVGGVRQLSIPGSLAYGDTNTQICDGANSPLKFIIMAIESNEELAKLNSELDDIYLQLYYAYYGSQLTN